MVTNKSGISDLEAGNILVGKTILAVAGSFDEAARNTGTAAGNILTGNSIKIQNVTTDGSFSESTRNTDPGVANVKKGTNYKTINVAKVGTLSGQHSHAGAG